VAPPLRSALAALALVGGLLTAPVPDEPVTALVVLRSQAAPVTPYQSGRHQRRQVVERALRAHAAASQRGLLAALDRRAATVEPLWIVDAVVVTAPRAVLRELAARPDVREVRPESTLPAPRLAAATGPVQPNLTRVGAPALWDLGYRGQGVVVASLDTGVDATHPDLAGRWRGGKGGWYDPNGQHPTRPVDVSGHGTATMGVLVGGDAGGSAIGMAPDARWIAAKIFNDRGVATTTGIHRALQWLLDPDRDPATADAPDVVLNAWTGSAPGCRGEFQPDLANLRAAGILPVFAAGNYGPSPGTVFSPAADPPAVPVGAVDGADVVDPASSRGPSPCGGAVAPRLVAPGVGIRTTDRYGLYVDASGTSLAAPHVAGAAALLLSAYPDLTADQQEAALEGGAVDLGPPGPDDTYGYGRLDVPAAFRLIG
jgi:subtilisin family serine protease